MRGFFKGLACLCALVILACLATSRPRDSALYPPAPGVQTTRVFVVDHGYHASLVFLRADLADMAQARGIGALTALSEKFRSFGYLEIGWGDDGFYRGAAQLDFTGVKIALRALFGPDNASVLHIVGLAREPGAIFPQSHVQPLDLSNKGAENLARFVDKMLANYINIGMIHLMFPMP